MTADHVDDERSTTRRSVLKSGLIASVVGIGGAATGMAQTDTASSADNGTDSDTHTLTVSLIETRDASVVSGEVTVNGQTKTTRPIEENSVIIQTEFELEDGTYTVSGTFDRGETWRTNEREVTIDGENKNISLLLYPPGSDELEENDGDTHTLTVYLIESEDADIVSGEVTVDGQTKPTTSDNPHVWSADFELENGTYTVSGMSDAYSDWRTNEPEITIDGDDIAIELFLYPPGSDELEETDPEDDDSQDDTNGSADTDDDPSDETDSKKNNGQSSSDDDSQDDTDGSADTDDVPNDEMDSEEDDGQSSPDVADDTSSVNQNQDTDNCP